MTLKKRTFPDRSSWNFEKPFGVDLCKGMEKQQWIVWWWW